MKIFITKYALTTGIIEAEAEEGNSKLKYMVVGGGSRLSYFYKKDYRESLEDAQKQAQEMILARVANLEKSIIKVKKLQDQPVKVRKWGER
jgi:predicted ATP-grasp superfamily ATP-dependent carboligase